MREQAGPSFICRPLLGRRQARAQAHHIEDRKGRRLSEEDIADYRKIVVAMSETIRLMAEIDRVIDEHGARPGAFQPAPTA